MGEAVAAPSSTCLESQLVDDSGRRRHSVSVDKAIIKDVLSDSLGSEFYPDYTLFD